MSTFTDWNGPQGSNVRASDLVKFANAYAELTTKLDQHIQDNTSGQNVHRSKDYIDEQINLVKGLLPDFNSFLKVLDADTTFAKLTDLPNMSDYARRDQLDNYALASSLADYLKKNDLANTQVIQDIEQDITAIEAWINSDVIEKPELKATYITGLINVVEQIQFTDKTLAAFVGGSDAVGVYYILGMLKDKAGTAYIRMGNTKAFSAAVNFAVTPEWKGALSVTTDCELKGLKFKIVSGTSSDGEKHAYLAIQSTEWIQNFASTDGVGKFSSIEFDAAGINFVPVNSDGWKQPNAMCHTVCDCKSGKGFSFSELATNVLNTRIYKDYDNPYVTRKDITALDAVGIISQWPFFDTAGVAIDVPEGYHACDGTAVLDTDDVSDEFRAKFTEYPLVDFSIIKTKSTVEYIEDAGDNDPENKLLELARAVCKLHGIELYTGVSESDLPTDVKSGVPALVETENGFKVLVKTPEDEWISYETVFNDVNKAIDAIAATISAVHSMDVFTVYTTPADLPTGPDVETGAMAIVYDGINYAIYKYSGTAWEIQ